MCAGCNLRILNGACRGDEKGHFTYVCAAGCSIMDYYLCSQEFTEHDMKQHVAEKFESKHLPVELLLFPKEYQSLDKDRSVLEKLVWDNDKKVTFVQLVRGEMFQNIIIQAKDLLTRSVDEAVNCLNSGLLEAAAGVKRKMYKGPKISK